MHQGSCQCGAVRYEIDGELGPILCCHCGRCRKANGAAFQVAAPIATSQLRVLSGEDAMVDYESSPGVYRVFCGRCGSPLWSKRDATPDLLRFRIGTLDTPVDAKPTAHIFVAEKAPWWDICDDLPQYPERP